MANTVSVVVSIPKGAEATVSTGIRWGMNAHLYPAGDNNVRLEFKDHESLRSWLVETLTILAKAEADDRVAKAEYDARQAVAS